MPRRRHRSVSRDDLHGSDGEAFKAGLSPIGTSVGPEALNERWGSMSHDEKNLRYSARTARMLAGTLRGENIQLQEILVRNVSSSGLSGRCKATPPPVGTSVTVSLGVLDNVEATVRWSCDRSFGLQFAVEIDPSIFNFANRDRSPNKEYPTGHVYDQFRPVSKAWRPGVKSPIR